MKYEKGEFILVANKTKLRSLKPAAQCLFMWLCAYANNDGECWPSRERLRQDIGASTIKTVDRHLKQLEALGFVTKRFRYQNTKQQTNGYQLQLLGGTKTTPLPKEGGHFCQRGGTKTTYRTKPMNYTNIVNKEEKPANIDALLSKHRALAEQRGIIRPKQS